MFLFVTCNREISLISGRYVQNCMIHMIANSSSDHHYLVTYLELPPPYLSAQRTVSTAHVYQVITECNANRSSDYTSANKIRYVETSMQSGLGLEYIYKYFGVPFLQLQVR